MDQFKKSEFFNGKYEDSFINFLQLVDEELNIRPLPLIRYKESNPPINPLIMRSLDSRIKKPTKIAEEIASVLENFEVWKKETKSGIIIWLHSTDGKILQAVILTLNEDKITPRIYVGSGVEKYNGGISWFWTYPFYYDYCT